MTNQYCQCCAGISDNGVPRLSTAVARWNHWHGGSTLLCIDCLNAWFDNADEDEGLEPPSWCWLGGKSAA
ncbi:hypothetical protein ACH4FX_38845 [Streptomyces sp. NPDC018019]|uniref:hypothetical protein n=1 Tax=Streptomyces sp. NPDC018019 TaxID=3365030 RepID=UPI0037B4BDD0